MDIELFTTTPQSVNSDRHQYMMEIQRISKETEKFGFKGMLVYSDNRLADAWMVTSIILAETSHILPMIALQPVYMHPYTVAKKIATIGLIYNRQIALNLIAGGFTQDLSAMGDHTPHDRRYNRLAEYTEIIRLLLTTPGGVTYKGEFYDIRNLKLQPELPEELQPKYYLSGSSDMARATAKRLDATLIEYPEPPADYLKKSRTVPGISGIRIGIMARPTHDEAWNDAYARFPKVRFGELMHQMAARTTDSVWHKSLAGQNGYDYSDKSVYWLGPFKQYHTFCPYLVGDYDEVARELSGYLQSGCKTCIIDIPISEIDLKSTIQVFDQALNLVEKV